MNNFLKKIKLPKNILKNSANRNTVGIILIGLLVIIFAVIIINGNKSILESDTEKVLDNSDKKGQFDSENPGSQVDLNKKETNTSIESKDSRLKTAENMKEKKQVKMLVLGDEITESYGVKDTKEKWLGNLVAGLEQKYGFKIETRLHTSEENSVFGSWVDFAEEIEKSDEFFDIVMICHGKNEGNLDYLPFSSAYEELVRRILKSYPGVQVLLVGENSVPKEEYYQTISKIANYYGLGYVDMRDSFNKSGKKSEELTAKSGYPSTVGYQIYKDSALKVLAEKIDFGRLEKFDFRVPLFGGMGEFQNYYRASSHKEQNSNVAKMEKYKKRFVTLSKIGDSMEATMKGSIFGVYLLKGPSSGKLKFYMDDFLVKEVDLYSPTEKSKKIFITNRKDYSSHNIRLEVSGSSNDESSSNNAYIFGIISNTKASDGD